MIFKLTQQEKRNFEIKNQNLESLGNFKPTGFVQPLESAGLTPDAAAPYTTSILLGNVLQNWQI